MKEIKGNVKLTELVNSLTKELEKINLSENKALRKLQKGIIKKTISTPIGRGFVFINEEKGKIAIVIKNKTGTYKGITSCNFEAGDNFNGEFGIELACLRAMQKAFKAETKQKLTLYNKLCEEVLEKEKQLLTAAREFRQNAADEEICAKQIDELLSENYGKLNGANIWEKILQGNVKIKN